jgi:Family of unknown function (DUF5677)
MHEFSHGFLSAAMTAVRAEVLRRHGTWHKLLLRVNEQCVEAQYAAQIDPTNSRALLAAAHFARLLASVQGAVLLLEHGLVSQAKTVLRMALESLFALEALRVQPEIATDMTQTHEVDKRVVADRMLQWEAHELKTAAAAHISDDELKGYLSSKARELKTYELANAAGMLRIAYQLRYQSSMPAHGTVSDIAKHLVVDQSRKVVALKNEPEVEGQGSAWACAIEIELKAAESFAGIFVVACLSLDSARAELKALVSKS